MDDELKSSTRTSRESVLELIEQMGGETTIPATSAAALSNKLLQALQRRDIRQRA